MAQAPTLVTELEGLVGECKARLDQALTLEDLENLRVEYLGRKGRLAGLMPPSFRLDLEREADLIEEVGRVYGLDHIPPKLPRVSKSLETPHGDGEFAFLAQIKHFCAGAGLHEAVVYSFVGQADLDLLGVDPACRVAVANPLSEDQNVMRLMSAVLPSEAKTTPRRQ